jgi:uncharacterized protein (DUF2461 family)
MTTIAAIEGEARKPKIYMRIETEGVDDLIASFLPTSVAVTLRMLRITINTKPCETKVEFKETKNSVTMIIQDHCLAITPFGHLHLKGKKIVEKNKPYRAIYEIRLLRLREDQERDSTPAFKDAAGCPACLSLSLPGETG